jgi:NHL repeat
MKFDKDGKFLLTWGKKGMGPSEFDVIHTLAFDSRGRLFVGDRQNNRIQIFDQNGTFIAQWFQLGRPSGIYIAKDDVIYVADSESRDGRTNTGQLTLPQTGYGYNPGAQRVFESAARRTVRSGTSFRMRVHIPTRPARAWRKTSWRIPKAMYTVRIFSGTSGSFLGTDARRGGQSTPAFGRLANLP